MKKTILSLITIFSVLFFYSKTALAQNIVPLRVAPVRTQLTINPGETSSFSVSFFNFSNVALTGTVKVVDFIVDNTSGNPRLLENQGLANPKYSASTWISLPYSEITIAPGGSVQVPLTVQAPLGVKAGGRYAAVYFETNSQAPGATGNNETGSAISPRVVSLIYIRIPGDITESASIVRFFANSFLEYGPIDTEAQIVNRGDYHISPKGTIKLQNLWGKIVDQTNLSERNIFPDSILNYNNSLGKKWLFGRYQLTLDATYGDKGQVLTRSLYVWVFPWRIITVAILAIVIFTIFVKKMVLNSKKEVTELESKLAKEEEEISKLKEMLKDK